jgi:general secretion pathway protein D
MIAFLAALPLIASSALIQGPTKPSAGNPPPAVQPPAQPASAGGAQNPAGGQGSGVPPIQDVGEFYILNFDETGGPDSLNLESFVKNCQDATGINFTYSSDTAQVLQRTTLRMFGTKRIPKSDFYQFFQIMMIINDFVCTKVGPDHLSVVLIQSMANGQTRGQVRQGALYVMADELDRFADQPAVLITTVVDLPHTDVRNLANSMRQMFQEPNTQQIVPVGNSNSLIITGFGSNVVSIVKMLKFVDDASSRTETITPEFEVMPLEFASAEELADTITELLEASRKAQQARGATVAAANGVSAALQTGQADAKILVDPRTNSLLVMAMPDDMPRIKELIARLDVDVVQGERTYHIYNLDNVDADELSKVLDTFIKDASRVTPGAATGGGARGGQPAANTGASAQRNEVVVVADKSTNSLLIAANRSRYEEILALIQRLDQRQEQVLIETALVELSDQNSFNLTVELGLADLAGGDGQFGVSNFGLATYTDTNSDGIPDLKVPAINSGLTAGILSGNNFSLPVLVSALKTRRDTNVLNVPSVLVNNNKSAKVVSKDEQPTTTITATGGVTGQTQENFKEYVEAGITLEISPTISASHYLRLNCSLEVSNFIGTVSGAIPPPRTTRTIQTTVNVPDGDTMVIGGIITDNNGTEKRSVPWLGDIPILGYLFGSNSTSGNKTTLYFFVTPHIMRDRDFADLAEYSYKRKLEAADTIGADRIRVVDPTFGREKQGVDMRGFEVPLYRGPERGEVKESAVGLDPSRVSGMLKNNGEAAPAPAPAPKPGAEAPAQPMTEDKPKDKDKQP